MTNPAIVAIGLANPPYKQRQLDTAELIAASLRLKPAEKRLLKAVYRATGIDERYSVLSDYCKPAGELEFFPNQPEAPYPTTAQRMKIYKDNAFPLALAAIENCLVQLEHFDRRKITHVITVSCTGMYAPGLDIEIVQGLKLNSSIKRTVINFMGCYGVFNALKVAEAFCKAEADALVLIVSVELCTLHFQKNMSMDNLISNSIFADGAAAALIQAQPQARKFFSLEHFHSDVLPQTSQEMTWEVADHGFDIALSSYVPEIVRTGIGTFVANLLKQAGGISPAFDFYAIHPGGIKILQACELALQLSKEHNKYAYQILRSFGNMSSATVLFVLKALWKELSAADSDKNVLSCAFGPGLTFESMILKVHC